MSTKILVRYGELSTKGRNKKSFTQRLAHNIKQALSDLPKVKIIPEHDFMFVELDQEYLEPALDKLKPIFGIQSFSPIYAVDKDLEVVKAKVLELVAKDKGEAKTFKIYTKRTDHDYPYDTNQLNQILGGLVLENFPDLSVQVKKPELTVRVDVRHKAIFLSSQIIQGAGGLPVGSSGRAMLMLSGGIDSPVAAYLAMKRGMEVMAVHFASPPYTSPQALDKTKRLAAKVASYSGSIQFITVPFAQIQEEIKKKVPENYLMTVMRRMMMRITDQLRQDNRGLAILTGESVGQVASQTLESMVAINDVTNTPVIRPVATMDKLEIIKIAEEIDTFQLSILPYEDCCTVFAPPSPKTRPNLEKTRAYESRLDIQELIDQALAGIQVEQILPSYGQDQWEDQDLSDLL